MFMGRIGRPFGPSEMLILRLLRRWAAAREAERNPLPSLTALAQELGQSVMVAVALDSVLQLTEACLGRPLSTECCCSPTIGPDERAVLMMIASVPAPALPIAAPAIPHGLPGVLTWAAMSLRSLLGGPLEAPAGVPAKCPFERS